MADDMAGKNGISLTARRAATDPAQLSTMDNPAPADTSAPRVRFSEDLDRATASSSSTQRPGTPNLTIDTNAIPQTSTEPPRSLSGAQTRKPLSPSSALPVSPRARDRGYSLRRSLFTRSINIQSEGSPIELVEAGPSGNIEGTVGRAEEAKGKKATTSVFVSPVTEGDAENSSSTSKPSFSKIHSKDKKTFGTLNLPNYDTWVRTVKKDGLVQKTISKIQWVYEEQFLKKILRQHDIPPSKDGRHIDLNATRKTPLIDERTGKEYIGNAIRSSRYTIWNFLPRQLFFQFSKLANAYFLLVSILQMIPGLSPTGSYTTIAPLLVFVSISMAKEGYDDLRRYRLDKVENNNEALVLHAYQPITSLDDERPNASGNAVKNWLRSKSKSNTTQRFTSEPYDGIVDGGNDNRISISGPKHWATLKWKDVKVGDIIKLQRDEAVPADIVLLHADGPNGIAFIETMALDGETNLKSKQPPPPLAKRCSSLDDLGECRARVVVEDPNLDLYNFDGRITVGEETLPLTTNEIVFRGSILRNTSTAIGMVINSGEECKVRLNANRNPRIKAPEMQRITNKVVLMLVAFVIILSLFCTIAYQVWTETYEEDAWYLNDAHVKFSYIIVGFIILFNTLIPLSLYVSLEIIKVGQLLLMDDTEMYDPISKTPMVSNTSTILENLGQIDYVFSDKTGTLTDNVMRFRKLSVAGYAWLHDFDLRQEATENLGQDQLESKKKKKGKGIAKRFSKKRVSRQVSESRNCSETTSTTDMPVRSNSLWKSSARPTKAQPELRTEELLRYLQQRPHSVFTKKAKFFLLSLALCHTCLPEIHENGDIEYQAASPDELALVRAAQELGYIVIDRPARSITLKFPNSPDSFETITETYEVLDVIEFSSKRKRMSIIVRFPNGKICIFCKGADSAILPRLKLASVALQKVSEVIRRSSKRKSIEAEQALRRMSESSPRTSLNRPSLNLARSRPSVNRRSIALGRSSTSGSKLQPIRDELDTWLKDREHDVEMGSDDLSAYYSPSTPRASMGRFSFASSEHRDSIQHDYFDELVDEAVVLDDATIFERCFQHIDDFASEGLRTLLFGYRFLDEEEYNGWKKIYMDATTSLVDRQNLIETASEMIEQDFDLAGATAIEDKLQHGVPETIDKLRRAGIKIWMLTGDKRETAINIAHSARICKSYSEVIILDRENDDVEKRMATAHLDLCSGAFAHAVVVVDGQTLADIDANETLSSLFFSLVIIADSVICCRASPSQKASLVKKIRTKVNKSITLAIGDGANDIAMIQEAHVGIGISGKEGLQAARISDYSIAQFRFLQRLLFVHGHWNYVRTGKYILGTFWKELLFYLIQALYQKWNGYTGTSLFESASLTVFNTLFTSLPVLIVGIFEQDLAASTLLAVPELYVYGQRNQGLNLKKYFGWMFMAVSEAAIIYFLIYGLFGKALFTDDNTLYSIGDLCFTAAVIIIVTKMLILEMHNKTLVTAVGWILSVGGWFLWNLLLSALYPAKSSRTYNVKNGFILQFGRNALWWLTLIIALISVILLELGVNSVKKAFWPNEIEIFQELQKDKLIRKRFEDTVYGNGDGVEMGRELELRSENISEEQMRREGEIQELLERPRVMVVDGVEELVTSPVEIEHDNLKRRSSLRMRKMSAADNSAVDVVELSSSSTMAGAHQVAEKKKWRHSVDIAELMGRRRAE